MFSNCANARSRNRTGLALAAMAFVSVSTSLAQRAEASPSVLFNVNAGLSATKEFLGGNYTFLSYDLSSPGWVSDWSRSADLQYSFSDGVSYSTAATGSVAVSGNTVTTSSNVSYSNSGFGWFGFSSGFGASMTPAIAIADQFASAAFHAELTVTVSYKSIVGGSNHRYGDNQPVASITSYTTLASGDYTQYTLSWDGSTSTSTQFPSFQVDGQWYRAAGWPPAWWVLSSVSIGNTVGDSFNDWNPAGSQHIIVDTSYTITTVPAPSAAAVFGVSVAGLARRRRR